MNTRYSAGLCAAGMMALGAVVFAQQTPSPQTTSQPRTTTGAQAGSTAGQQVTLSGCIQREADYRKTQDAGRGGVAGTGVGAGNEFVLVAAATTGTGATGTTGAAGTAGAATAYELSGKNEGQAAQFVGRRVEISGMLKPAEVGAAGKPTGGPTAGKPPEGVDVASRDLQLRELEVTSIKPATGACPTP